MKDIERHTNGLRMEHERDVYEDLYKDVTTAPDLQLDITAPMTASVTFWC
jgi:hypothetical protein